MKLLPPEDSIKDLSKATLIAPSPTKNAVVHHILMGNKDDLTFGRNHFPSSCPRSATKRVSRMHCQISWNATREIYSLKVTGTNGIKLLGTFYGPGESLDIKAGSIIDFVGLKVLFLDSESCDLAKQFTITPVYEPVAEKIGACSGVESSQDFSESVLEDATLGNISFALNNSFEVVKSCKAVFSNKCLDPDESVKALDKKLFGDEASSPSKDSKVDDAALADAPSTSVDKAKSPKKPRKKRQPKSQATLPLADLNPRDNKKIKLPKALESPSSLPSLTENSFKKSDKDNSEALSEKSPSETSTPIKMLSKESAQPDDELLIDLLLQTLVGMGKRTPVALKVLHDELLKVQPSSELTPAMLASRLASLPMFIKVPALGPLPEIKNDQFYYSPELDWNPSRKVEIGTLVRKPRGCTLSSKQYYFKPLPKLPKYKGYGPKKDI